MSGNLSTSPTPLNYAANTTRPLWLRAILNPRPFSQSFYWRRSRSSPPIGTNFFTQYNALEIVRFNVELGLLALALTPVIVTGGIDLSVGSLLGLCAVLFGKLSRDAHLSIALTILCTLGIGTLAGLLNATLITLLRIPPLIVTLGTYSLFAGLAEGNHARRGRVRFFQTAILHLLGSGLLVLAGSPPRCRSWPS